MKDLKVFVRRKWTIVVLAGLTLVLLMGGAVFAKMAETTIDWRVISGGGSSTGTSLEEVTLHGSLGQAAAGTSSGGEIGLSSGYWGGIARPAGMALGFEVFIPVLMDE